MSDNIAANITTGQQYGAVQGDTVVLVNTEGWVTPASATGSVKLFRSK